MKKLVTLSVWFFLSFATAQVEVGQFTPTTTPTPFDVDAISFASPTPNQSRLDIFAAIGYEQLSFIKRDNKFVATYELTIAVYDSSGALVSEKLWTEEVNVQTFDQSVSTASYSIVQRSIELSPGQYRISVICRDLENKVTRRVAKQLVIANYDTPGLQLSDIMLISKLSLSGEKRTIVPSISANVGNIAGPMHIFFEAYNEAKIDSVRFECAIFNEKGTESLRMDSTVGLTHGRNQIFLRIDQSSLPVGDYKLFVKAFSRADTVRPVATTSRSCIVRWSALPASVKDLDVAVDQLVYIAKEKELDHIKAGATPEEKQKRFLEFWKKRDPNPNTTRNEKMEQHYARIEYANRQFKHYSEGWRTDMGMVYVIFGSPSNVDRHPFDSDSKPYEVWAYFELNYSFVFIDQTGFGDYRLTTPIWDVLQRARN